ncbi:MAG: hypothetical protein M1819_002402 [Sarea resinae]|nr:MAG: hypothetical protein M1819_002402 [Sarea resinae]
MDSPQIGSSPPERSPRSPQLPSTQSLVSPHQEAPRGQPSEMRLTSPRFSSVSLVEETPPPPVIVDYVADFPDYPFDPLQKEFMEQLELSGDGDLLKSIKKQDMIDPFSSQTNIFLRAERYAKVYGCQVLFSLPKEVKTGLIKGDLLTRQPPIQLTGQARLRDVELAKKAWPVIYGHFHVHRKTKQAPTANQYFRVIGDIENYIQHFMGVRVTNHAHDLNAHRIDAVIQTGKPCGFRDGDSLTGKRRYCQSDAYRAHIETWLAGLRCRLRLIPIAHHDKPIPWPLCGVGYTSDPATTEQQHREHTSSQQLMYLVRSAFDRRWPDNFEMEFMVLYECWNSEQAPIAEHVISRLCFSYVPHGGFNVTLGGVGNISAQDEPETIYEPIWEDVLERGHFTENLEFANDCVERKLDLVRQIKQIKAEVAEFEVLKVEHLAKRKRLARLQHENAVRGAEIERLSIPYLKRVLADIKKANEILAESEVLAAFAADVNELAELGRRPQ